MKIIEIKSFEELRAEVSRYKKIVVYGNGKVSKSFINQIKIINELDKVMCKVVSKKENISHIEDEIPVYAIEEIGNQLKEERICLFIATFGVYKKEMLENAKKYAENIIYIADEFEWYFLKKGNYVNLNYISGWDVFHRKFLIILIIWYSHVLEMKFNVNGKYVSGKF